MLTFVRRRLRSLPLTVTFMRGSKLSDCAGEKFFRGLPANCGEYATRPCVCGALQNSHQKLLAAFGPGTPITAPPHVTITSLMNGAMS